MPALHINKNGGVLTYCNHEFDQVHIIDIEFGGTIDKLYYCSIDG